MMQKQNIIISPVDINITIPKNITLKELTIEIKIDNNIPNNINTPVGTLTLKDPNNDILAIYPLYSLDIIQPISFIDRLFKYMKILI